MPGSPFVAGARPTGGGPVSGRTEYLATVILAWDEAEVLTKRNQD